MTTHFLRGRTHTHRHTQTQTQTHRHRHRHTQTQTHTHRHTDTDTQTQTQTHTLTHTHTEEQHCTWHGHVRQLLFDDSGDAWAEPGMHHNANTQTKTDTLHKLSGSSLHTYEHSQTHRHTRTNTQRQKHTNTHLCSCACDILVCSTNPSRTRATPCTSEGPRCASFSHTRFEMRAFRSATVRGVVRCECCCCWL